MWDIRGSEEDKDGADRAEVGIVLDKVQRMEVHMFLVGFLPQLLK